MLVIRMGTSLSILTIRCVIILFHSIGTFVYCVIRTPDRDGSSLFLKLCSIYMHGLAQLSNQLSIRPSIDCYYRDQEKLLRHEKTGGAKLEIAVHLGKS